MAASIVFKSINGTIRIIAKSAKHSAHVFTLKLSDIKAKRTNQVIQYKQIAIHYNSEVCQYFVTYIRHDRLCK